MSIVSLFDDSTNSARLDGPAGEALTRLYTEAAELLAQPPGTKSLEDIEREVREMTGRVGVALVAQSCQSLDVDLPDVVIEGRRLERGARYSETYVSTFGTFTVERTLYRCEGEPARCPLELRAGIVEGYFTPLAARQASYLLAHITPQETSDFLRESGAFPISKSTLDRLAKGLGTQWETHREAFEAQLRESFEVPAEAVSAAVSLDGVMVPMKDGGRAAKRAEAQAAGRQARGPAGYREASCATVSLYDAEGERLGTVYAARMPESGKTTLKKALSAEIEAILAQRPDLEVVKVADGARDNWRYLDKLLPEATSVVDFFHACGHLKDALDAAYGENSKQGQAQFRKLRHVLLEEDDGVGKVIRALDYQRRKHPRRKRIAEVLGYFRGNRHRMAYAQTKARKLAVGSGVVEAACKTLATERLKRSGMRWRHNGGQAILTLRALVKSGRFDSAWEMLSDTYRKTIDFGLEKIAPVSLAA